LGREERIEVSRSQARERVWDEGEIRMKLLTVLLMTLPLLAACEKKGPLERAAEEVDEAFEDAKNGGETLGNKVDDAIDDVNKGVKDATDELTK
jgi:predicted small lipoprotein YifL